MVLNKTYTFGHPNQKTQLKMSSMSKFNLLTFICLLASLITHAQPDPIRLNNPSFEDTPKRGGEGIDGISGWIDCGKINFPMETPPDIHPKNFWGVNVEAQHGKTYLGMVARDNNAYESVMQELASPLLSKKTYSLDIYLAQSPKYLSRSRKTSHEANYTKPSILRIIASDKNCNVQEILYKSPPIEHQDWKKYTAIMTPKDNVEYLILSVYSVKAENNGHILVDGLSDIIEVKP